jgi:hypothetical protein
MRRDGDSQATKHTLSLLTGLHVVIVCNIRLASRLARVAGLCFELSPHVSKLVFLGSSFKLIQLNLGEGLY